jgi:hypothetical protein
VVKEVDRSSVYLLRGTFDHCLSALPPPLTSAATGAVNSTVAHRGEICDDAEAFNVIIDLPVNVHHPMESVMLYLPSAVVAEYTIILPGTFALLSMRRGMAC